MSQPTAGNKNGYITLLSVIILMILAVIVISYALYMSIDSQKAYLALRAKTQSKAYAYSCAETALEKLRNDLDYTGNEIINTDGVACTIHQITGSGNYNRTILVSGNSLNHYTRMEIKLTVVNPEPELDYWKEIP